HSSKRRGRPKSQVNKDEDDDVTMDDAVADASDEPDASAAAADAGPHPKSKRIRNRSGQSSSSSKRAKGARPRRLGAKEPNPELDENELKETPVPESLERSQREAYAAILQGRW